MSSVMVVGRVEQPDPLDPVNPVQVPQEPGKGAALPVIHAEIRRVLGDQQQLAHALIGQVPGLREDRLGRAAAVVPAQRRMMQNAHA